MAYQRPAEMAQMCDCRMCAGRHDHWGQGPAAPLASWQEQVANGDTRLGYWDWVEQYTQ